MDHDISAHPLMSSTLCMITTMLTEEISDFVNRAQGYGQAHFTAALGKLSVRIRALAEVLNSQALGALPAQCKELRGLLSAADCSNWCAYLAHEDARPGGHYERNPGPVRILAGRLSIIVP